MKRILSVAVLAAGLSISGAAWADDDECRSPMSQWQPREAVMVHVAELGIEVSRLRIDDGCYKVRGQDAQGNQIELKLDPATLGLAELEVSFRPGADPSRYLPGARAVAAPVPQAPQGNPLIAPGTIPQVRGN